MCLFVYSRYQLLCVSPLVSVHTQVFIHSYVSLTVVFVCVYLCIRLSAPLCLVYSQFYIRRYCLHPRLLRYLPSLLSLYKLATLQPRYSFYNLSTTFLQPGYSVYNLVCVAMFLSFPRCVSVSYLSTNLVCRHFSTSPSVYPCLCVYIPTCSCIVICQLSSLNHSV